MKRLSAEGLEALAARYVLGVLGGPARRRFEREMMNDWRIRQEVWFWERQLQPLATQTPALIPPSRSWDALSRRLWPEAVAKPPSWWWRWFWPGWSAAATLATGILAVALWWPAPVSGPAAGSREQWMAVVQSAQAEPLWLVDTDVTDSRVRLKSIAAPAAAAAKDYELWLLPAQGNPQSIGILPTGDVEITVKLSAEQFKALLANKSLAISLEPKGGSPTGLPTGPVVYQSKLLKI